MKMVVFKHHNADAVFSINPDQVCAVAWVDNLTSILTSSQVCYFTKEPIGSVIHRLEQGLDIDFADDVG